jgi:hypothetical protein
MEQQDTSSASASVTGGKNEAGVAAAAAAPEQQQTQRRRSGGGGGGATAAATTWVEDEKSWTEYGGLTVVARMERVKKALQDAVALCDEAAAGNGTDTDADAGAAAADTEAVLTPLIASLTATLPLELRPSLPWSALVNLINAGLGKVDWAFPEGDLLTKEERRQQQQQHAALIVPACKAALAEALRGVTHWLPNAALDHAATPTTGPSSSSSSSAAAVEGKAPEMSLEEYRAMWPVEEGRPVLRVLGGEFPRRPYKAQRGGPAAAEGVADAVHWGQRKLFMNELELLTLHAAAGDTVLYAGAAPGKHIAFLADRLFPELTFVLVDPAPFRIRPSARIRLVQGLMTDELAREYSTAPQPHPRPGAGAGGGDKGERQGEGEEEGGAAAAAAAGGKSQREEQPGEEEGAAKRVIFVSDIRRTHASEDLILEDMLDQQRWHDILRPKVCACVLVHARARVCVCV